MGTKILSIVGQNRCIAGFLLMCLLHLFGCSGDNLSTMAPTEGAALREDKITKGIMGTVTEVLTAGEYTIACIDSEKVSYWLATTRTDIGIGDDVVLGEVNVMRDFYSPALERQFPAILFVDKVTVVQRAASAQSKRARNLPSGHPLVVEETTVEPPHAGLIPRAPDGYTVAELYEKKKELAGTRVRVAGKVVKVNSNIMGLNWIHLKDGSDFNGDDDLTVTSNQHPKHGAVVEVAGLLVAGRTFQKGFHVPIMIEGARLSGEAAPSH